MATNKQQAADKPGEAADPSMQENKWIAYGLLGTGLLVTILLTGVAGTLDAIVANKAKLGDLTYDQVWDSFKRTLPLSMSVMFIVFGILRGWIADSLGGVVLALAILLLFTLLLQPNGWGIIQRAWEQRPDGLFGFPVRLVAEYLIMYWWKPFVAGILCGGFAGWAMWLKTRRYLPQ